MHGCEGAAGAAALVGQRSADKLIGKQLSQDDGSAITLRYM
jgi:hypothetical protein